MWYRRAADIVQIQRDWLTDLHFYQRIALLCRWIQTSRACFCCLFWLINPSYRRLASTPLFFPLKSRFPTLQLLDCTCFPLTGVHTQNLDRNDEPNVAPQPQQRCYDLGLTSLSFHLLPLSASNHICVRTPYAHSQSVLTSLVLLYPLVGREESNLYLQRSQNLNLAPLRSFPPSKN